MEALAEDISVSVDPLKGRLTLKVAEFSWLRSRSKDPLVPINTSIRINPEDTTDRIVAIKAKIDKPSIKLCT